VRADIAEGREPGLDRVATSAGRTAIRLATTRTPATITAISQTGTNIKGADLHTKDGSVFGTIFVEVDNLPHLAKVLKAVRRVKGVTTVERRETPPGK